MFRELKEEIGLDRDDVIIIGRLQNGCAMKSQKVISKVLQIIRAETNMVFTKIS